MLHWILSVKRKPCSFYFQYNLSLYFLKVLTCTNSCSSLFTSSRPPMSSHVMLGTSTTVSLRADGLLWLRAHYRKKVLLSPTANQKFRSNKTIVYLEVIHSNRKGVHDFCINSLILKVNQVHFLSDGLQRSLRAQSSQICTNMAVSFIGYLQNKKTRSVFVTKSRHQIQAVNPQKLSSF